MDLLTGLRSAFSGLDSLWLLITSLGSEEAYIVLLALYFWFIDPHSGRRLGILMGISFFLNDVLKLSFNTQRPFSINPSIASEKAISTAGGPSFPSGHAQNVAAYWGFVAILYNKSWLWLVGILLIILVSFSRLVLGVHFLGDILGGIAIGLALVIASFILPKLEMWPLAIRSGSLLLVLAVAASLPEYSRALGVTCGFFLSTPNFTPANSWPKRILYAIVGLVLVFAIYIGTSRAMGSFGKSGVGACLRYLLLTLFATEVCPRIFRLFNRQKAAEVH